MTNNLGRPMIYDALLAELDDDELYSPSAIARFAENSGWLDATEPQEIRQEKTRIRIAMGRFSNNHGFPDQGDGMVHIKGQAQTPAWFGWRWKAAAQIALSPLVTYEEKRINCRMLWRKR